MNHTPKHKEVLARLVKNVPTIRQDLTIGEVVNLLLEKARDFQTISYVYVVDQNNKLIGTVSVMEIFSLPKDRPVKDFMKRNIVTIHPNAHQERAAMLAIRHNIKSVPVVDKDGYFLGIIPSDAIMSILHEEHIEDALKAGGFTGTKGLMKDLISSYSYGTYFKKRLPWLIFGLIGGVMAALAIELFESTLKELLTLAAFVPAIVYMADAVGAQTQTIFIRSLAIDQNLSFKKYMKREIIVGVALAAVLGVIISAVSFIWWSPASLGVILGFSFFVTIIAAIIIAMMLPWFFLKIRVDPAVASGPFATTIRDLASVLIYFGVANVVLGL
ncbi:MAG TPA: magnesium transporter [Candidatus Paceibacterota bacterium]